MKFLVILMLFACVIVLNDKAYAYTDRGGMYKITFPKGWMVSEGKNKSSDYVVRAIHPEQIATITIETFEDDGDTNRFFRDPVDFAKAVPLRQLRKNCPNAELYNVSPIDFEGYKGLECSMYCNPFYYTGLYFVRGQKIIFILTSFLDDQALGMTVKRSVSSLQIIKDKKKAKR